MTTQEKLSKFVIKSALKELQQKKRFKTLDQLREELEAELKSEGYAIDSEEKDKIKAIVEEDGYTGRFAVDDIIWKKLRNKKYWPAISVAIAVIIFIVSNVLGGVIEYYVQKPLSGAQPTENNAVIAAFFQLPSRVEGGTLEFKVTVQNQLKKEALKDLILFASVDNVAEKIAIDELAPEGKRILTGKIDIHKIKKANFFFNAYIIGARVSFRSEPIEIEKTVAVAMKGSGGSPKDMQIAADFSGKRENESLAANTERSQSKSSMARLDASSAQAPGTIAPSAAGGVTTAAGKPTLPGTMQVNEKKEETAFQVKGKTGQVAFKEMNSDSLVDETITSMKGLAAGEESQRESKLQLLKLLADTGNEKAGKYLEELKATR